MDSLCSYKGKADIRLGSGLAWHPLPYHCLDAAAVATTWLEASPVLRAISLRACGLPNEDFPRLRAWFAFFVALHDLGKFHALFQWVLRQALGESEPPKDWALDWRSAGRYFHGPEGYALFCQEYVEWIVNDDVDCDYLNAWQPWMQAVTGHHGELPEVCDERGRYGSDAVMRQDRAARLEWVSCLEALLLRPAGLSLRDQPPSCSEAARTWFAGLCSISDWVGSNTDVFPYAAPEQPVEEYFSKQCKRLCDQHVLAALGLVAPSQPYGGLAALLGESESPRGVQTRVEQLPLQAGLTLIEAPTGSGKTEAALAYAWRLIEAGLAEAIVFALPTQATANGMLQRAEAFARKAFGTANVVLAHGKRDWTEGFQCLINARLSAQGREEAAVQCSAWLAQSRKRVFLGQVGVCTVDQALLAVLPVRHKFVRGFGLQRAVLIVDEVHAYDSYMHGLLGELLRQQQAVGGSAILLSATLPSALRADLLVAWGAKRNAESAPYPVIWQTAVGEVTRLEVESAQLPEPRTVAVEHLRSPDAMADEVLLERLIAAARDGARVGVVLNRVDAAQALARQLRQLGDVPVDIFHSRFRYRDRMVKEQDVMQRYGRKRPEGGRILVATQVIEQSLDLDFDWLITQICPVDLLFQRLGRLHRHRRERPPGFETPRCVVLSVEADDYGSHALIYGNTRVLWRTDALLNGAHEIVFPAAYRAWIEKVYEREDWVREPERVSLEYDAFRCLEIQAQREAIALTKTSMTQFRDEESRVLSLTRGNEMGLMVLPLGVDGLSLDGEDWSDLDEREQAEVYSLNGIPVPATKRWKAALAGTADEEGRHRLVMEVDKESGWCGRRAKALFRYGVEFGLELEEPGVAARLTPQSGEQDRCWLKHHTASGSSPMDGE